MSKHSKPVPPILSSVDALSGIIDAVPHPIFVKDEESRFVTVNEAMCRLMGRSHDDLIGRTDYDFVPREQADIYRGNDIRVLSSGESNDNEELLTDKDGRLRIIVTEKKRLVLAGGTRLIVGCITDISDFRQAEALIRHNAEHDALTGLPNRRLFYSKAAAAVAEAADGGMRCAVLLVDLDRFKPVNDIHGHATGDAILCAVASRLTASVRETDTVARMGGDEFAVLCRYPADSGAERVAALAERLVSDVSKAIAIGDENASVSIGASIGIAEAPKHATDIDRLLHFADLAMYRAKSSGRGRFCFYDPSMEIELRDQAAMEADLRTAIAQGQIVPFYQPIFDLSEGSLVGFEVLARWQHPARGTIGPDLFIPVAERLGLATDITLPLLSRACRDAARWPRELTLAFNISPLQLHEPTLPLRLLAVLSETDFPPNRIEIEITESALVGDTDAARAMLATLRGLGMKSSLDDFGTGYSNMYHLQEMYFDKIKIDRSFVQSMQEDPEKGRIISAFVALARVLELPVVAEGIETRDAMTRAIEGGCSYGQGYYFGRAVPAGDVPKIIDELGDGAVRRAS